MDLEMWGKAIVTVAGGLLAYHKFILRELEKKVDKEDCQKQNEYVLKLREETNRTLFKKIDELRDEIRNLNNHLLK